MAVVSNVVPNAVQGPRGSQGLVDGIKVVDFTFSNSYTTGGEALTPASVGFATIDLIIPVYRLPLGTSVNSLFTVDQATNKIIAKVGSTGAEVANATDLSATTLRCLVIGA